MPRKIKTVAVTSIELSRVFDEINSRRYPEKNTALILLIFTLGLTPKELVNLRVLDIFHPFKVPKDIKIRDCIHIIPERHRNSSDQYRALNTRKNIKSLRFSLAEFESLLKDVEARVLAGEQIVAENYHPIKQKYFKRVRMVSLRDIPLLVSALEKYMSILVDQNDFDQHSYFFRSQKGGGYSANTMQEHIALILKKWSGVKGATSLSGKKTVAINMINRGESITAIARFLGYSSTSSSFIRELGIEIDT